MEFGGASYKSQNIGTADLYLTPPLGEFGLGEYKRASEMAEVGYRYSVEKVAEWLASSPLPQNAVANSITVAVREPGPASAVQLAHAESQEASA
jgi:hypothetical protein